MNNRKKTQKDFFLSQLIDGLHSYEIAAVIYLFATSIVVLFTTSKIPKWQEILIFHLFVIILIFGLGRIPEYRFPFLKIIRGWYLLAVFPFLFKELTILSTTLFPYYFEPVLIKSELFFINFYHQYLSFLQISPLLTEIMAFSYWSYYVIIFGVGLYAYKVLGDTEFEYYMFKICTTFLISYALFILIPVRGPHHAMENTDPSAMDGWVFQSIILFMQSKGSTVGAAFPSSHVAIAWISVFTLRHFKKRVYYMLMPLMILLSISVFYLRYHYFLDAIFGYFLAIVLERGYILISEKIKLRALQHTYSQQPVFY
jgi:hypothetical protein